MTKLLIGGDPEFIASKNDAIVPAIMLAPYKPRDSAFGTDGHNHIGELRPGYSDNIIKLIAKVELVLKEAESKLEISKKVDKLLAGHFKHKKPLGGHIHFSNTPLTSKCEKLAHLLDFFLEDCLEDLIAPKQERAARTGDTFSFARSRYGVKYSQSRHAIKMITPNRFEYRPPGSWLLSPKIMYAYLYVAKVCGLLTLEGKTIVDLNKDISHDRKALTKIANLEFLTTLIKPTAKMHDLELGAEILREVIYNRRFIDWDEDFRKNWGL